MPPRIGLAGLLMVAVLGCKDSAREVSVEPSEAVQEPSKIKIAKPDLSRMAYHADSRTLQLYDLEEPGAKWMIALPWTIAAEPVGVQHSFMNNVNPEKVFVFYTTAKGVSSPKVSLQNLVQFDISHHR